MSTESDPIAPAAEAIMGHVNGDHTNNLVEYLRAFTDVADATEARMVGVDRNGFDIEAKTPAGSKTVRIPWGKTLERREQVREEMVRLSTEAQAKLSS
jgi:putative heme iron utilization protein